MLRIGAPCLNLPSAPRDGLRLDGIPMGGQSSLCHLFGSGHEEVLIHRSDIESVIGELLDLYERWGAGHLNRDEDHVARFLTAKVGRPLRMRALAWIDMALNSQALKYRADGIAKMGALTESLHTVLLENATALRVDAQARDALLRIIT